MKTRLKITFLAISLLVVTALVDPLPSVSSLLASPPQEASLLEDNAEGRTPQQLALWMFSRYGCHRCHTLTTEGRFGLTALGMVRARDFQGCPAMLGTISETMSIPETEWTEQQRQTRIEFEEFGCTVCHQIEDTRIALTQLGEKAASLHMSCSGVAAAVSSHAPQN